MSKLELLISFTSTGYFAKISSRRVKVKMIRNKEYLEEFEKQMLMDETLDFARNLEIYEALWQEAVELGIFPLKDPYDGVEDDIRLAKILNRLNSDPMDDDEKK